MFSNGKNERLEKRERARLLNERLDHIGRELVRANQTGATEIEETIGSPFFYARLRTRIVTARENVSGDAQSWWLMLVTAWRPLMGMALIAVTAALLFWFTIIPASVINPQLATNGGEYLSQSEPNFDRVVFTDGDALSDEDVLKTIFNQDGTDVQR